MSSPIKKQRKLTVKSNKKQTIIKENQCDKIELVIDESEETGDGLILTTNNNNFNLLTLPINDESMIRFSPTNKSNSKRNSLSNYHQRLNISNILKNGGQDTIDEEDNIILSRLI